MGGVDLFMGRRRSRGRSGKEKRSSSLDENSGMRLWRALLTAVKPPPQHHREKEQHFHVVPAAPATSCSDGDGGHSPAAGGGDVDEEPNAIDLRAEEFIARFYEQMRLQQLMPERAC